MLHRNDNQETGRVAGSLRAGHRVRYHRDPPDLDTVPAQFLEDAIDHVAVFPATEPDEPNRGVDPTGRGQGAEAILPVRS
jgi:hypothetical protein